MRVNHKWNNTFILSTYEIENGENRNVCSVRCDFVSEWMKNRKCLFVSQIFPNRKYLNTHTQHNGAFGPTLFFLVTCHRKQNERAIRRRKTIKYVRIKWINLSEAFKSEREHLQKEHQISSVEYAFGWWLLKLRWCAVFCMYLYAYTLFRTLQILQMLSNLLKTFAVAGAASIFAEVMIVVCISYAFSLTFDGFLSKYKALACMFVFVCAW